MSDLSLQLQQAASQLPVSSYFDDALFQRELETIFQRGPRYVGHQLSVPNAGDYYALPQEGEGRALVRNAQGGLELISNVCRHRQAVMLKGKGSLQTQQKGSAGPATWGTNFLCPTRAITTHCPKRARAVPWCATPRAGWSSSPTCAATARP